MAQPLHGPNRFNRHVSSFESTENEYVPPNCASLISMRESDDKGIEPILSSSELSLNAMGVNLPLTEMAIEFDEKEDEKKTKNNKKKMKISLNLPNQGI